MVKFMSFNIFSKKNNSGFSTIEMLIAMAILVIFLSAIILVSFGSQLVIVDSQTYSEAISIAQEFLEKEQALGRKDFKLVVPLAPLAEDIYKIKVDVETQPDFFTKKVTATVSWPDQYNRGLNVKLSAFITNFENAVGGDTCNSILTGDWTSPNINDILVTNTNNDASLSVDAYKKKVYVALSDANATDTPTIFIYDSSDPGNPQLIYSLDNADTKAGINAVRAAEGSDGHLYLYAAKATGSGGGQFQIFNVSDPYNATQAGYDFTVNDAVGTGGQAVGNSIFYKDGYIYLGLTKTASGPEFHIIDVHNPANPFEVGSWPQTGSLGNDINAIYVKGKYVYLATPNTEELIVLDISNPILPVQVDGFDSAGGGHGKSLYSVGDTLYLGNTVGSDQEFYILNNVPGDHISSSSSQEISSSVNGLLVRSNLAFLLTKDQFQILKVSDPLNIVSLYNSPLAGDGNSLDCEGNYLYAGSVNSSSQGYLSIISTP